MDNGDFSYFPGCSMVTTAMESNLSLMVACRVLGLNLVELDDWNCCGSSSAAIIDPELGFHLACRNLSLAPPQRPLVVMCPRCLHQLRHAHLKIKEDRHLRRTQERQWHRSLHPDLEIMHFLEPVVKLGPQILRRCLQRPLAGLKVAPYYGCTLFRPPALRKQWYSMGELESILKSLGAQTISHGLLYRCCGSFLSVLRPQQVSELVNQIIASVMAAGAECLVTVCALCQLNLEMRTTLEPRLPIFHFSEILALALGAADYDHWFARHLVDPYPLLTKLGLI